MSEISLLQQIKQIDDMMQYILLIKQETENLNNSISDSVDYLRQNGLRTETADTITHVHMGYIIEQLGFILERMQRCDYTYLQEIKDDLESAL